MKYPLIIVVILLLVSPCLTSAGASTLGFNLFPHRDTSIFSDTSDEYVAPEVYSPPVTDSPNQAVKVYMERNDLLVRAYNYRIQKFQEDNLLKEQASEEQIDAFPQKYDEYIHPTNENPSPYENIFDIWEGYQ